MSSQASDVAIHDGDDDVAIHVFSFDTFEVNTNVKIKNHCYTNSSYKCKF